MSALLDSMRAERERPTVLALAVLRIRSERPDSYIFIFEGIEDVGVYNEWLRVVPGVPPFESIPSAGKKQVLGYISTLVERNDALIDYVYAFVDRDFERDDSLPTHVHSLEAHSFEVYICCREAVSSLLVDEFRCAPHPRVRNKVLTLFDEVWRKSKESMRDLNFLLFACQRSGRSVEKKPEKLSHFLALTLTDARPSYEKLELVFSANLEGIDVLSLRRDFDRLDDRYQFRGKYLYMIFRKWIDLLCAERVAANSEYFSGVDPLRGCTANQVGHRRLASAVDAPESLIAFVERIKTHGCLQ